METPTMTRGIMTVKKFPQVFVDPESETPGGIFFLTSLDHTVPPQVQTIYAFRSSSETVGQVLKQSLAKALVHFYPLAGALALDSEGRFAVDCSKKSVAFVEAVADCTVDMIGDLRVPDEDTTRMLVHMEPDHYAKSLLDLPLLTAQVTKFTCGGFTLGLSVSHVVMDGKSAMTFVNSWAEIARGGSIPTPFHDRSCLRARVPPIPRGPYDDFVEIADISEMESLYQKERNICRLFSFSPEKIATIKKAAMADGRLQGGCTTFSVIAAVVWRSWSRALKMKPAQLTRLRTFVDVRSKFKDPLPENYFGNLITTTCCLTTAGDLAEQPISCTVEQIRKACEMVDEEYVRSRIDYIDVHQPPVTSVATLAITSWTRLAFASSDFGWGAPTQFGFGDVTREVCLVLPEGERKKGILVTFALPVSAMAAFQELIDHQVWRLGQQYH